MRLHVGERLEGIGPAHQPGGYVVTSVIRETPWHGLYAGKKIFYNFDFTAKRVRETDEVEWLDVFLRTNRYPILDDPTYVAQRRALARAEVRGILSHRHSNLWPEPLDLLEIDNTRDPFTFASGSAPGSEPVVVYARPQGRFTHDWQQQILPITSILSVLAEVLEFMKQAHEEGLLLLGLGPQALLIDASDRVHYVGTDLVLAQSSALLKEAATPAALWSRLFPADRFARGYAAPECYTLEHRPSARTDLYAWGVLAYSLLVGTDLGKLADEQGHPWIELQESHWTQFEKILRQLPENSVHAWADQLGVSPRLLLEDWPRKLIAVFRLLLSPDAARRPRSVPDLLAWLADPPPPPIAGLVAIHTGPDFAKLLLDCTGTRADLEATIQCTRNSPAQLPTEGSTIVEGPLRPVINVSGLPVTTDPIYFTAFTRHTQSGQCVYSSGVSAALWEPTPESLRAWVEDQAARSLDWHQIPAPIQLMFNVLDLGTLIESLQKSPLVRVRAWVLRHAEGTLRGQAYSQANESILWRFLAETNGDLRQRAAALLWDYHPRKGDDLLLRLVEALEAPPVDSPISVGPFLRRFALPETRIRMVLEEREARQPTTCPVCAKPLPRGDRRTHLQAEHGYLIYQGDLVPGPVVFHRLWERVFDPNDSTAHDELLAMYQSTSATPANPSAVVNRYVADLHRFLVGKPVGIDSLNGSADGSAIPVALPYASILAYQANLRGSRSFFALAGALVRSSERRLRDMGTQAVLPYLQAQLEGKSRVEDLRHLLTQLCSGLDQTDLQIDLCRRLEQLGVDQGLIAACIDQLREERLVRCSDCGADVRARDMELHLRRAHRVFEFRGTRKTYVDTRQAILQAVSTPPADLAAWKSLQSLAEDKHPGEADRFLVIWLSQYLKEVDAEQRAACINATAEVMVAAGAGARLAPIFVGPSKNASWELLGQGIALEIACRLPQPIAPELVSLLIPLLDQRDLPRRLRENAVMALLRSTGANAAAARAVLAGFVRQSSKKRGIEKLQRLEQRFGHSPAIDALTTELEDEIRMSCPRCPTELRKKDMVGHLWEKHGLVLDGQRVREPWRVLEDWVVDYGLEKDPQVLMRCKELAKKADPQAGLARLQRMLYRHGVRDRDLLHELRRQAHARNASLCPACCALVPIEAPPVVQPLTLHSAKLEGYGYHLEVSEQGLFPSLHVESPDTILYHGREPGRGLTRLGAMLLLFGPVAITIFVLLYLLTEGNYPPPLLASVAAGVSLVLAGFLYLVWPSPKPARERLVKAAWKLLVPEMLQEEMNRRGWGFLHGLLEITDQIRTPILPQDRLLDFCEEAREQARTDPLALACLGEIARRHLANLGDLGEDPIEFVLTLSGDCFKGKLPLAFLSRLVESFQVGDRSTWKKADRNRLTILVANQAFHADVEIDDWLNLGRAFPEVGDVFHLDQRWHWMQFFALWCQRNRKPWEDVGPSRTMLDIARAPADYEEILAHYPDVLFYVRNANLVIGSKGVWIEGVCVTSFPHGAEVSLQKISGHYELTVGPLKIRCGENPRDHLDEMQRWLRYYFHEFLPTVATLARPLLESRHRMWILSRTTCPECGKSLVPCPGDLGVALR